MALATLSAILFNEKKRNEKNIWLFIDGYRHSVDGADFLLR